MKRLGEFFQEQNGSFSSTRLAFLLWAIGVLAVWIVISIRGGAIQPLPESLIMILGVLMTGKVVQKWAEPKSESPANPESKSV